MLAFVLLTSITFVAEGSGGMLISRTSQSVAIDDTTIYVDTTAGFSENGIIIIGNEEVYYNGRSATAFLNCTRGYNDTTSRSYTKYSKVYNEDAATLNDALGQEFVEAATDSGAMAIPMIPYIFFAEVVPKVTLWQSPIFYENGPMQMLRIILLCFSVGFIFVISITIMSALSGVAQGIIGRIIR